MMLSHHMVPLTTFVSIQSILSQFTYCDPMPGQPKPGIMLKNLALSLGDGVS